MDNSSLFLAYCHFHDSVIADVDYNDGKLILDIPKSYYEDTYDNLKVEIEINDYDFVFYYFNISSISNSVTTLFYLFTFSYFKSYR